MESIRNCRSGTKRTRPIMVPINKTGKKTGVKNSVLDNIMQEYCLKRNQFDPKKPSPNRFVNKLQLRMKVYYRNLYSLSSSPNKY